MESKILAGRYELIERIGMGGMAVVYKATDNMLDRNVAIKILREEYKENEEFIHRFKVESQAAASLSHQNIVQIYDVGEEDGLHYIVMELLEGVTLKEYIKSKGGILTKREAMNFAIQICRALEHAHSKHVVHRDIKPQNIVLTEDGKIKVADFGIARAANNTTTVNAGTYAVGSAHYLSPEQARGGYTDNRSDIYSFGVVLYELFTGKLPFDAEESISIVMQHIHEEPTLPSKVNPDVTPAMEAIIMRAMNKEQRLRYESASEILEDLVMIYQRPNTNITKLHAYTEETAVKLDIPPVKRETRTPTGSRKKKKKSGKGAVAAVIISFILIFMIAFGWLIYSFMFPDSGNEYEIPDFTGMTLEEAHQVAKERSNKDVKFDLDVEYVDSSEEEIGIVIRQTPEGGSMIKKDRRIKVLVGRGPILIKLPDYTGQQYLEVSQELEEMGIKVIIEEEDSIEYDEGEIIEHFPAEGTQLRAGDEITLRVSKGAENIYVPGVVGKTQEEAIKELAQADLEVKITEESSDTVVKGDVIRQNPKANTLVPAGTVVEIVVSSGKEEKTEDEPEDNPEDKPEKEPEKEPENKPENKPETTTPQASNPSTQTQTTPSVQPVPEAPKTVSVPLANLSTDSEKPTRVKIIIDGKKVFEADVPTTSGSATVSFEVPASVDTSKGADISYNGNYATTKEVK